jgi:hypothetical protein
MPHHEHHRPTRLLLAVTLLFASVLALDRASAAGAETDPVVAVNAGGGEVTTTSGVTYAADTVSPTAPAYFTGGRVYTVSGTVTGTPDAALYQEVRSGSSFDFVAPNLVAGSYDVTLDFVEPVATQSGDRLFDVIVEGATVLEDFDIFAAAGGRLVAHTETVSVDVLDGELNVTFATETARPVIAAVAVSAGTPAPSGDLTISPQSIDFGGVVTGTTATADITVTNGTAATIDLVSASIGRAVFSLESPALPVSLAAGGTATLTVGFSPLEARSYATTLTVTTSDAAVPTLDVPLSGHGISAGSAPDIAVDTTTLDFGSATIGTAVTLDVSITNTGASDLVVSDVAAADGGYAVAATLPATIEPGGALEVAVTYAPTEAADGSSELVVTSSDPDEPELTIALTASVAPYPVGTVAVIGCSNTRQHVTGYLDESTLDQLAPNDDLGGGSLPVWAEGHPDYWAMYEEFRPVDGYLAAWVQICLRVHEIGEENEAQLAAVVEEIEARDGDIPIIISPLNSYEEGHVCDATGPDGPAVAADLADWADENLGTLRGPDTGPLGPEHLRRDGCHLNQFGGELVGEQLVAFFDPL